MKNNTMVLYDRYPLIINPTLAELIGLNEAIVLQQIHYWTEKIDKIIVITRKDFIGHIIQLTLASGQF